MSLVPYNLMIVMKNKGYSVRKTIFFNRNYLPHSLGFLRHSWRRMVILYNGVFVPGGHCHYFGMQKQKVLSLYGYFLCILPATPRPSRPSQ